MATVAQEMTTDEFLKLPDDGVDRELIRGELRERPTTTRMQITAAPMPDSALSSRLAGASTGTAGPFLR